MKQKAAVLDRRQANFRGPGGFKAKNLTLKSKAKTKNFKTVLEAKDVLEACPSATNLTSSWLLVTPSFELIRPSLAGDQPLLKTRTVGEFST